MEDLKSNDELEGEVRSKCETRRLGRTKRMGPSGNPLALSSDCIFSEGRENGRLKVQR
jgi:hypothetical protein